MTAKVIDQEQRNQAINPEQSFIVQAPAGSGKTELLIQRYLRLLASVEAPEEIIAITFTRKAAAEMRGRIIQALQNTGESGNTEKTKELASQALVQDKQHNWRLIENPGRLRVQTIDSLCAFLTRQMPILAQFGAQPETLEDPGELYQQAAANTLAEIESGQGWSNAIATLLIHLDNDLPRVRNMLANMLARRDQWLRHIVRQHHRQELEAGLIHVVESSLTRLYPYFDERLDKEFFLCLSFAANNLGWEKTEFDSIPGTEAGDLTAWQAIANLCLTKEDKWRKQVNKNQGFPAGQANKEMKDRFQVLLSRFSTDDKLLKQFVEIKALPPVSYTDKEWEVVDALYQLLVLADAQLRVLFAEKNQIDFGGITQAAIQALGTEEVPTNLALHLDYQIKHILLDEFQDISINQYVLLERLTAGWSTQDGHSLFLVGDPMQSIYRFREAEVGLFLNAWEQKRLGQVPLNTINITVNFRSAQTIVNWVNDTFSQVLPSSADVSRGAVNYVAATAFHEQENIHAVQYHSLLGRDDVKEAETVLSLVKSAQQQDVKGNTAILVRNRSHLHEIVPRLKEAGLRFRAVEIESLGTQVVIQDLLALCQALSHFADRIAWLAILRAPWCGLTLDDLFKLAGDTKTQTVWECMHDEETCQKLSDNGQQRLKEIRTVLEHAFLEQGRRRLSRWVESVWMSLGGPATLSDETDLENTRTFFTLLNSFDQGGEIKDRVLLIKQVSELFAAADVGADDSLQLMTIHKAKGLEFDTVILPGLARGTGADGASLLLWMEMPHAAHQDLLLAPIKEVGEVDSPIYTYLRRLESEKQRYEEGRLLYVAATRAKKQLHILTTIEVKHGDDEYQLATPRYNSLLAQLWPVVRDKFDDVLEKYEFELEAEKDEIHIDQSLRRLSNGWQIPKAPEAVSWFSQHIKEERKKSVIEFEWASETIMHVGSVVHRYIQLIAEEGLDKWDQQIIKNRVPQYALALQRLGVGEEEITIASERTAEALTRLLEDPKSEWLLSKTHKEQRNEYAVSGLYEGRVVNVIIDRTFIDENGVRWIVDYKTSRHEGADKEGFLDQEKERYREQLEKYAGLLSSMEDRPVRLGLYFPLLQGWREWAFEASKKA